jgi:hypothetical protein
MSAGERPQTYALDRTATGNGIWPEKQLKKIGNWVDRKEQDVSDLFSNGIYYDGNNMLRNGDVGHPLQSKHSSLPASLS